MGADISCSFEFFPPKDLVGEERLWAAIDDLKPIAPDFVSVTYGAGGGTRDRSVRIASEITKRTGIPTVGHLTCVGSTREALVSTLEKYKISGVKSILALRGDPLGGLKTEWTPTAGGLNHADELVQLASEIGGFTIGVAAFPDGHPESGGDLEKDIEVLLRKEKFGATFATTQFFFDVNKFKTLSQILKERGSSLNLIPGILPITNMVLLNRMAELGGIQVPLGIERAFAKVKSDPLAVRRLGVEIATELCNELLAIGVQGLHFYTMNSSTATIEVYRGLNNAK